MTQPQLFAPPAGMTRVGRMSKGQKLVEGQVYAGRGPQAPQHTPIGDRGWLGNPYDVRVWGARAMPLYVSYFLGRTQRERAFADAVRELRGSELLCWCVEAWDPSMFRPGPDAFKRLQEKATCHAMIVAWVAEGRS